MRDELIAVLSGGCLAGNAELQQDDAGAWIVQGDPTEAAFLVAARKLGGSDEPATRKGRYERIGEIPFTSQRKMMSTLEVDHVDADAHVLFTKGAPDVLLAHCTRVLRGSEVVALDDAARTRILADVDTMTDAALRTLGVARRTLAANAQIPNNADEAAGLEQDLVYIGTVGIIDPPRVEAAVAIDQARLAGIRVIMITGDHPRTAARAWRPSTSFASLRRCKRPAMWWR